MGCESSGQAVSVAFVALARQVCLFSRQLVGIRQSIYWIHNYCIIYTILYISHPTAHLSSYLSPSFPSLARSLCLSVSVSLCLSLYVTLSDSLSLSLSLSLNLPATRCGRRCGLNCRGWRTPSCVWKRPPASLKPSPRRWTRCDWLPTQ